MTLFPQDAASKQLMQKVGLGAIILVLTLVVAWRFLLSPLQEEKLKICKEIEVEQAILDGNRKLVNMEAATTKQYEEIRRGLLETMQNHMPPSVNAMAWAGDTLRRVAVPNHYNARPRSIGELGVAVPPIGSRDDKPPLFEEYNVRSDITCNYHEFGPFVAALEKENLLMRVEGFELRGTSDMAGSLGVNLRLAFLRFNEGGFPAEERPDAEIPRLIPKEPAAGSGKQGGEGEK